MPTLLDDLNPIQSQATLNTEGPTLILAGAGSGKTRVLTYKIAYLISEKKVAPENILAVTFTNKAAGEMKDRIKKLLFTNSQPKTHNSEPIMGTFHSICARLLRRDGKLIGLSPSFTIYDENDALDAVKEAMATLSISPQKTSPSAIRHTISGAKNEMISSLEYPQYAQGFFQETAAKVYIEYQNILRRNQALDFDDLLLETIKLFKTIPQALAHYQNQFKYILVDEYQDTNTAQYTLIKMLASRFRNICVVGDASQCLLPNTLISTPSGEKPIKDLKPDDLIIAAAGRGKTFNCQVQNLKVSKYNGKIFNIKTKSGKTIKATPNHILFARLNRTTTSYYVYLMYRQDKGYRIGIAKGVRTPELNRPEIGLLVRSNQESADKMWVLKVCKTRSDANFWEHWFVVTYGIPSMVFSTGGRKMLITQEQINELFRTIDTKENVKKIFSDFHLFEEYPHHHPKGVASQISPNRQLVHLTLFSDKRASGTSPWSGHRVSINTSDKSIEQRLKKLGHYTREGNKNTWRIETCYWDYEKALNLAEKIATDAGGLTIAHSAFIVDNKKFLYTPVSHLRESMEIGVLENNQIVVDEISSVEIEDYQGDVYDLNIANLHNYIANGIVVHNSIYGFRGADFRNIVNFKNDYKEAKVFNLEQNYRSTQVILDAAKSIISENRSHPILKLWTQKKEGSKIRLYEARSEVDEANFIIQTVKKSPLTPLSSYAVLYRTNAQSRAIEEAFLKSGVPYILVGGLKFYERKEIKDVLCYLRLINHPEDSVCLKRVEKIGKGRLQKFLELRAEVSPNLENYSTLELLDLILQKTGYLAYLDDGTDQGKSRIENVKELRSVAEEFPNLVEFLENVSLIQNDQMPSKKDPRFQDIGNAVTLMTIHASKGLEFPTVFLVGLEEGLFPHSRALLNSNELEEERRLAYVAITRAKSDLYLTYTRSRLYFGQRSNSLVSRFIASIPEHLLDSSINITHAGTNFDEDITVNLEEDDWLSA